MSSDSGITYQADLPLSWRNAPTPSEAMLSQVRFANITVLHALATLESSADRDHDADPAVSKAIDRIEAKLDITLALLIKLVTQQTVLPASVPVTLGANRVEWIGTNNLPENDTTVLLGLHLSPRLPEPLQIYARVTTSQTGLCMADFLDRDEEFEEWITRTLFRYHRRALQARRQT